MSKTAFSPRFRWELLPGQSAARDALAKDLSLDPIAAQVLLNRDHDTLPKAKDHLDLSLRKLPDPKRLPDFGIAMEVMDEILKHKHPVLIHGDYDVDGTCGSVLLHALFERLDLPVSVFIPDRVGDGYSFSENSFQAIEKAQAKLVVAVDNGTTSFEPMKRLREMGIRTLVLDHHPPKEERPVCDALINPWTTVKDDNPVFPWFCGAGIAWLFAWGLLRHAHQDQELTEDTRRFLMDSMGLAAIATVADSMKLIGPNRSLVQHGLATIPQSSLPGLRALAHALGFDKKPPTATDVSFRIAPHLNAAGRMNQAALAFRVLATNQLREGVQLAEQLKELNVLRQGVQADELKALLPQAEVQRESGDKVVFAGRPESQFGVLGVVAAKIQEATGLPTLLWAECSPGVARGSARGPAGTHLVKIMDGAEDYLEGYGGHAEAAGFHFDPDHHAALHQALRASADALPEPKAPTLTVDMEVHPLEITLKTLRSMERLEPFGKGFPSPLFLARELTLLKDPRSMTEGRHASLELERDGQSLRAVGFSLGDRLLHLHAGDCVDLVFQAVRNEFRGRVTVDWHIQDFRTSTS